MTQITRTAGTGVVMLFLLATVLLLPVLSGYLTPFGMPLGNLGLLLAIASPFVLVGLIARHLLA